MESTEVPGMLYLTLNVQKTMESTEVPGMLYRKPPDYLFITQCIRRCISNSYFKLFVLFTVSYIIIIIIIICFRIYEVYLQLHICNNPCFRVISVSAIL
jgi:hypothetical protein